MGQLGSHQAAAHAQRRVVGLIAETLGELSPGAEQSPDVDFYDRVLLTTDVTLCDLRGLGPPAPSGFRFVWRGPGTTDAMTRSLIGLPFRLGARCAGLAVRSSAEVAERALSLAGSLASVFTPASSGVDVDGTGHDGPAWEGYRQLKAVDVIDRITGASAAELAAVELYETTSKRRRTVLAAVERKRRGAGA